VVFLGATEHLNDRLGDTSTWQEVCSNVGWCAAKGQVMEAKEITNMAQIDQLAAQKELKEAAQLRAKAVELVEIADELKQEAKRHEHDALDLIAPTSARHRR
jgi:hypothetical protein